MLIAAMMFLNAGETQGNPQSLEVVSWNIEWFGHTVNYPPDDNLQEANVKKIMRALDADIYGLTEIIDTNRLRRVTDSLGQFDFVISPYCSGNTTGTGNSWLNCQKMAFVFNKNIFSNVRARGMMRSSATAYYNFASGRFPFLMTADVSMNGSTKTMHFVLLHGKAGSSISDYERRKAGAEELKDTLDTYFHDQAVIILGDFNDALDETICNACPSDISSYDPIIKDSVDEDHYRSITLPLALAGQSSMTNYPNLVDNHVISNEVALGYIVQSASVRTDVASLVVHYDATTSDHYPVYSRYTINNIITSLPGIEELDGVDVYPNPFHDRLILAAGIVLNDVKLTLTDITGRILMRKDYKRINASTLLDFPVDLLAGIYVLNIQSREGSKVVKLVKR